MELSHTVAWHSVHVSANQSSSPLCELVPSASLTCSMIQIWKALVSVPVEAKPSAVKGA